MLENFGGCCADRVEIYQINVEIRNQQQITSDKICYTYFYSSLKNVMYYIFLNKI